MMIEFPAEDLHAAMLHFGQREAALRLALVPDPDEPEVIQPLSWLRSMIDECRERGPSDDCDDPDAYWQMVREVEGLYDRARAALNPSS
jgi:hypothetical protein